MNHEPYGWGIFKTEDGVLHVMPTDENHRFGCCRCQPTTNEDGIVVHTSFDGREAFENGERQKS